VRVRSGIKTGRCHEDKNFNKHNYTDIPDLKI
jgi:Ni2+-binding GTPase involved in maturation of urease and hydrogenase